MRNLYILEMAGSLVIGGYMLTWRKGHKLVVLPARTMASKGKVIHFRKYSFSTCPF